MLLLLKSVFPTAAFAELTGYQGSDPSQGNSVLRHIFMYGEARTIQIVLAEWNYYPAIYEPTDGLQGVGAQRISTANRKQKLRQL